MSALVRGRRAACALTSRRTRNAENEMAGYVPRRVLRASISPIKDKKYVGVAHTELTGLGKLGD
jgi:hypothetical protein